jgi:exopolyphosphatase/guanosine-5'-triphosphate,3'-diphosphate pyrophosphatase
LHYYTHPYTVPFTRFVVQGAWETAVLFSKVDLNDSNIKGDEERNLSFVINWYSPDNQFRMMCNVIVVKTDEYAGEENPNMNTDTQLETYAAIDLGSNSFHMLVARREHGELKVVDRIKEMVRLGGGLDKYGNLDSDVQQRAIACLSRFGQRLRGIPAKNIRAVGTQTFRRLKHADAFLQEAESTLQCPIDIIAGREEARLIYLGVTQWVSGHQQKQLVMDIGGGSTELIVGDGYEPIKMESLQFGCVSVTKQFFSDGEISVKSLKKARKAVARELQEIQTDYRKAGWQIAIGSSGTIRSAAAICEANGWCKKGITLVALKELERKALSFQFVSEIEIEGLSERRQPVFIGGLAILQACFKALNISELLVSEYALREGLIQDQLGRLEQRDPRDKAVEALMSRFSVDPAQVTRVQRTALKLFDQLSTDNTVGRPHRSMLTWATELHEIGLSLSHASYQNHSAYLVEASDLAGFSHQEQLFLASLVGHQRRDIPGNYLERLPQRLHSALRTTLLCMRLAWIFCRTRDDDAIPEFRLKLERSRLQLVLPMDWMEFHPLTIADLESEEEILQSIGIRLDISCDTHE